MSEEHVYPTKGERSGADLSKRWLVTGTDLVFEGGMGSIRRSFRTRAAARAWAWWMWHLGSYKGGSITIDDRGRQ